MNPYEYGYYSAMKVAGLERLKNMFNPGQYEDAMRAAQGHIGDSQERFFSSYTALPQHMMDDNPLKVRQMADRMAGAYNDTFEGMTGYGQALSGLGQAMQDRALARGLVGGSALGAGATYGVMRDE